MECLTNSSDANHWREPKSWRVFPLGVVWLINLQSITVAPDGKLSKSRGGYVAYHNDYTNIWYHGTFLCAANDWWLLTNCTPTRTLAAYHDLTWHEPTQKYNQLLCLVAHIFVFSTAACGLCNNVGCTWPRNPPRGNKISEYSSQGLPFLRSTSHGLRMMFVGNKV